MCTINRAKDSDADSDRNVDPVGPRLPAPMMWKNLYFSWHKELDVCYGALCAYPED